MIPGKYYFHLKLFVLVPLVFAALKSNAQCSGVFYNGPSIVCTNSSASYFASGGNAGTCSVTWVSGGYTSFNGTTVNWGNTPGTYTVQFTCSCGSSNYSVTVQSTPTAGTIPGSSNQTICYGGTPTDITSAGAAGQLTWQSAPVGSSTWANLTTGSATLSSGSISSTTAYQYRLMSYNCNTTVYSNVVTVTVNQAATPPAPLNSNDSCGSQTLSFNGSPPSGTTWYWQGTSSSGTSTSNSSSTYSAASSGTYYLRPYNSGCWGTASSVNVTVNALPQDPNLTASFNTTQSCGSTSVSVNGSIPGGQNWYWQTSSSGTTIGGQTANVSPYTATADGTVYVRALNTSNNCWSANAASTNYTVKLLPTVAATNNNPAFCSNQSTNIAISNPNN